MKNRKTFALYVGGILIFLVLAAAAVWTIYNVRFDPYKRAEVLRQPRVILGAEFLTRDDFVKTRGWRSIFERPKRIGTVIEDVAVGELDRHPGIDVVVAGNDGALVLDRSGKQLSQIEYQQKKYSFPGDIQVIDIENDGVCEFLARGGIGSAAVFDHQGERLWSYGGKTSMSGDTATGDLDGDGVVEFVTTWDGLEAFDRYGARRWRQPLNGNAFQLEVVDTDGDGKPKIISHDGRQLTIRDSQGQVVRKIEMTFLTERHADFSLSRSPGKTQPCLSYVQNGSVWLADFNGNVVSKFNAPLSPWYVHKVRNVWIRFVKDQPERLAVLADILSLPRSWLYIYNPDGALVYQEVMPENCGSLAVLPEEDGTQSLLVGGRETVWRYKAR